MFSVCANELCCPTCPVRFDRVCFQSARSCESLKVVEDIVEPMWWVTLYTTKEAFFNVFKKTPEECGLTFESHPTGKGDRITGVKVMEGTPGVYRIKTQMKVTTVHKIVADDGNTTLMRRQVLHNFTKRVESGEFAMNTTNGNTHEDIQAIVAALNEVPAPVEPTAEVLDTADMDEDNAELVGAKGEGKGDDGKGKGKRPALSITNEEAIENLNERVALLCNRMDVYDSVTKDDFTVVQKELDAKGKECRQEGSFNLGRTISTMIQSMKLVQSFCFAAQKVNLLKKTNSLQNFKDAFSKVNAVEQLKPFLTKKLIILYCHVSVRIHLPDEPSRALREMTTELIGSLGLALTQGWMDELFEVVMESVLESVCSQAFLSLRVKERTGDNIARRLRADLACFEGAQCPDSQKRAIQMIDALCALTPETWQEVKQVRDDFVEMNDAPVMRVFHNHALMVEMLKTRAELKAENLRNREAAAVKYEVITRFNDSFTTDHAQALRDDPQAWLESTSKKLEEWSVLVLDALAIATDDPLALNGLQNLGAILWKLLKQMQIDCITLLGETVRAFNDEDAEGLEESMPKLIVYAPELLALLFGNNLKFKEAAEN